MSLLYCELRWRLYSFRFYRTFFSCCLRVDTAHHTFARDGEWRTALAPLEEKHVLVNEHVILNESDGHSSRVPRMTDVDKCLYKFLTRIAYACLSRLVSVSLVLRLCHDGMATD